MFRNLWPCQAARIATSGAQPNIPEFHPDGSGDGKYWRREIQIGLGFVPWADDTAALDERGQVVPHLVGLMSQNEPFCSRYAVPCRWMGN